MFIAAGKINIILQEVVCLLDKSNPPGSFCVIPSKCATAIISLKTQLLFHLTFIKGTGEASATEPRDWPYNHSSKELGCFDPVGAS